jgi:predicted transcriptional regulator
MSEQSAAKAAIKQASNYVEKWGQPLIAMGYCVVPNIIIQQHRQLGLDAADLNIALQLFCCWWKPNEWPFPSMVELSKSTGLHVRNVQRRVKKLEQAGFLKIRKRKTRHGGWDSNLYDLSGLIREASKLAVKEASRRKQAALEKVGRRAIPKGKPPLVVVQN